MGNIFSELMTRYSKLIQWHAMQEKQKITGLKKPFLMIMTKDFFKDFKDLVNKYHSELEAAQETITWENFLLRGLKADKFMWDALKPKQIEAKTWSSIFRDLQVLKYNHNILDSVEQNNLRSTPATWHNMDDPYAISQAAKEMYQESKEHILEFRTEDTITSKQIRLISDQILPENAVKLLSNHDSNVDIVSLGCNLDQVSIRPSYLKNVLVSHQYKEEIVLYQLTALRPGMLFQPTMGHVHTQHNGVIYSSPIGPFTKELLSNQSVYIYVNENGILSAKPLIGDNNKQVTISTFADYLKVQEEKNLLKEKNYAKINGELFRDIKNFITNESINYKNLKSHHMRNGATPETKKAFADFEKEIEKCANLKDLLNVILVNQSVTELNEIQQSPSKNIASHGLFSLSSGGYKSISNMYMHQLEGELENYIREKEKKLGIEDKAITYQVTTLK